MRIVTFNIDSKFNCPVKRFKTLVVSICRQFELSDVTISVAIVDNARIRQLNDKFLRRKTPTDCLAFDLTDPIKGRRLFELVINGQRAKSEAVKRNHSTHAEMALYITHGLLHLVGFDDHTAPKAKKMHKIEDEFLMQQGFGPVYSK